ncbi:MAG: hypothetical protein ACREOW_01930 [Thermodesulfobacteriota bacterium]
MKGFQVLLSLILLIHSTSSTAAELSMPQLLENKDVVILGETRRRPESTQFVTNTVAEYLQGGKCLMVGLEIPSHQQPVLERAFLGVWRLNRVSIPSIPLSSIIDHPGYRRMPASFRDHIQKGECLKVRAIDAPVIVPVDRDEWMEKQILEMMDGTPILVLVGNFHALKDVKWNSEALGGESLAERLVRRRLRVASVLQYWSKEDCELRREEVLSTLDPSTLEYIKQIMDVMNAYPPSGSV